MTEVPSIEVTGLIEGARWNGRPCFAQRGTVICGPSPVETWWCAKLEGDRLRCVRVRQDGQEWFILNEEANPTGERKVLNGGGFTMPHRSIPVADPASFEAHP